MNFTETLEDIRTRGIYSLGADAGVNTFDDREGSPAADFLTRVRDALVESVEWKRENEHDDPNGWDAGEIAHDVADGSVPVYTFSMWQTFFGLAAWQEDLSELGEPRDMEQGAQWSLYMIGERLAYALLEELTEAYSEEDTDA